MRIKTIITLFLMISILPLKAQEFKIGIVTDFKQSFELDSTLWFMVNQIDQTIGSGKQVTISPEDVSYGNTGLHEAAKNYGELVEKTDLAILIGGNSIKGVSNMGHFPVPTFGIGIIDPGIQEIPYMEGKSGIPNFTYIWPTNGLEVDLIEFRRIVPFEHLTLLVNPGTALSLASEGRTAGIIKLEQKLNTKIRILEMEEDILAALEKLNPETDAIYISDLGVRTSSEIRKLANRLIEKKIPSFSGNKWHVYQGILTCMADDDSFAQVVRKLGVMVDEALSGKPMEDMEVKTMYSERLFINEQTANAINLSLPFEVLFTAKSVKIDEGLPIYSLEDIIELSFKNNLNIAISNQDIQLAMQDVKAARSAVLPNLDFFVNSRQINVESASASIDQPQQLLNGQLQLDQVIFSQKAIAGIKIAKYYQKAQEYLTEADILEEILNTFIDYLNVLSAKSVLNIEGENLENLEINLNIASVLVESGALSRTELYRWESEVALARQKVVEASTNLLALKSGLNKRLAYVLEKEFDVEDISVDDQLYQQFRTGIIGQYVENVQDIRILTEFLVEESVNSNPNKKFLVHQINALDRKRKQDKQMFYSPDIALQAGTTQVFARGGIGSEALEGRDFIDNTWRIGVGLRYPIFAQTIRKNDLRTSTIQLDQLNNSRILLDQDLELAVRTAVLNAIAASTNIDFSRLASENADNNFKLMQIRYREGDIDITQLIDAQRNLIQAKLRYAVSVYDYISSQLNIQYAVGFFPMLASESKNDEIRTRFLEYKK
jgi:outer membrane protein